MNRFPFSYFGHILFAVSQLSIHQNPGVGMGDSRRQGTDIQLGLKRRDIDTGQSGAHCVQIKGNAEIGMQRGLDSLDRLAANSASGTRN